MDEIENKFIDNISKRLCLDSTRYTFASETCKTLYYMSKNLFKNRIGYHRLLLGRKGVGKTTFLKIMQEEAENLFKNLITIYIDYSDLTQFELPSSFISNKINEKNLPDTSRIKFVENKSLEKGKFVFLVLDEIQNLYLSNKMGEKIIGEISTIGCSSSGRFFCIITGSCYNLRQLCFAKLPLDYKKDYPNYAALDLNSTKYSAKWIYPFLEISDFKKVIKFIYNKLEKNYNGEDDFQKYFIAEMYLLSAGNARLMEEFVVNGTCEPYSLSLRKEEKDPNNINCKIMNAVYECTDAYVDSYYITPSEELPSDITAFEQLTKLIDFHIFKEKIGEFSIDILPFIYNLAESGHIRYIDNPLNQQISLGSPLIYYQLANKGKKTLTLREIHAFRCPNSSHQNIAETLTLTILAKNARKFLKAANESLKIENTNIEKIILKYDYGNINSKEIHANCDQNRILNRFFKECFENNKDVFGIDGLLLEKDESNENGLIAHRIQIKLGNSNINIDDSNLIINKVNSQLINFKRCFTAANKEISKCIHYLVTTRGIHQDAKEAFIKNEWEIVGKTELAQIWPDEIKALGKPYK